MVREHSQIERTEKKKIRRGGGGGVKAGCAEKRKGKEDGEWHSVGAKIQYVVQR